jgi:hypothetical protein
LTVADRAIAPKRTPVPESGNKALLFLKLRMLLSMEAVRGLNFVDRHSRFENGMKLFRSSYEVI